VAEALRIGITLPMFAANAEAALGAVRAAEQAGLDGVFAFDHLWPGEDRSRPALSMYPLLGAAAAVSRRLRIGSLVARLGLEPDRVVVESLVSLNEVAGRRLVAGLGIGDAKSRSENAAFGIPWPSLEARREALAATLDELAAGGIETWVGATSPATLEIARAAGATVNLWDAAADRVRLEAADGPTSWAGPLPSSAPRAAERLTELREAGATWAIWGWPRSIELVVEATNAAGIEPGKG
jgi:hypothetical protein